MRLAIVVAIAALALGWVGATFRALDEPVDRHGAPFAGSGECARCHPDHHASWARTHHRRMTQEANDTTVLGAFDGRTLDYGGYTARMTREGDRFVVEVQSATDFLARWTVERLVGSRRHQQLLAREDDLWVRLPIAWDVEEQRFIHMNGAFLTADPEGFETSTPIAASDYMRHAVRWNDNCVFCHNVGAEPRPDGRGHFDTHVAELGVACESCHGPSAEHVRANASPVRRYLLHETDHADPTVTSPLRLDRDRQTDVCGRCHGQRITGDVSRYLAHGDPFVPGDVLESTPLAIDTPLHGDATAFAPRFWNDGTARLTAYEHQGILQSRCGVTCGDCHSMHDYADVRGQLRADITGDAMCAGACHAELASPEASLTHSDHANVACIDCHMPRIVFGIRTIHPSHRIEIPRPIENAANARPDACSLCHVDARLEAELFGGDPIERAVAAAALGRLDAPTVDRDRRIGLLLAVMRDDPYPAVRGIAWRSAQPMLDLPLGSFSSTDDHAARARFVTERHHDVIEPENVASLRAEARAIEIGE